MNRTIDVVSMICGIAMYVLTRDLGTGIAVPYAIGVAIVFQIYLLPVRIAEFRNHRNKLAIWLLTVLGGWTGLFWIVGIIWAVFVTKDEEQKIPNTQA